MPDSHKKIKHFVVSRFFPFQRKEFPHNILDVDFLSKQLPLAKNMLRSLENQTNKKFELVFIANPKFFDDPKYEFIFSTLRDSTTLPLKFIKWSEVTSLFQGAYDKYDFVIQTRIDFDDFTCKDAVADTQSKVSECTDIISYGYCNGYQYIYGELIPFFHGYNDGGHQSTFPSLIVNSSFGKKIPSIFIYNFNHTKVKIQLKDFLEKNGVEFKEDMFQQNFSMKAFIYFRHEFAQELLVTNSTLKLPNKGKLTTADITKKQLEDQFGFTLELNSIK